MPEPHDFDDEEHAISDMILLDPEKALASSQEAFRQTCLLARVADDKKALNILVFDVGGVSSLSDYMIVCSAQSQAQVGAIVGAMDEALATENLPGRLPNVSRDTNNRWALLDYGNVIVHVMLEEARAYYQLEQFCKTAYPIPREQWADE